MGSIGVNSQGTAGSTRGTPVAASRVEVDTSDWSRVTGKSKPSGTGTWAFATSRNPQSYNDENEIIFVYGKYSDAKKQVQAHFGARGRNRIFTLG